MEGWERESKDRRKGTKKGRFMTVRVAKTGGRKNHGFGNAARRVHGQTPMPCDPARAAPVCCDRWRPVRPCVENKN